MMSQEVYCVAQTENEARKIVEKIKAMGIAPAAVSVASNASEVGHLADPRSQDFRNAIKGSFVGIIIGLAFGGAMLATMGGRIPGLFEALLLLACAAFGGVLFGALIGATGAFAAAPMSPSLERHFEEEVSLRSKLG